MKFVLSSDLLNELSTVLPDENARADCLSAARAIESVINEHPPDADAPASHALGRAARILATATHLAADLARRQERRERKPGSRPRDIDKSRSAGPKRSPVH